MLLHECVFVGDSRRKKKTTFIGGMERVLLRCNRDLHKPGHAYSADIFTILDLIWKQNHQKFEIPISLGKIGV